MLEGVVLPADTGTAAAPGCAVVAAHRRHRAEVATDPRTRTAGRAVARHGAYVVGGAGILARRAWDGRSAARYERMIRTAEAAGNHETAMEWEERGRQFRAARHQRRMDLLNAPQRVAKGAAGRHRHDRRGPAGPGQVLAVAEHDVTQVIAPAMVTIDMSAGRCSS